MLDTARAAKRASRVMARLGPEQRSAALSAIAEALRVDAHAILAANARDLEAAMPSVGESMSKAAFDRLKLDGSKLTGLAEAVEQLAAFEDPLGRISLATELDDGLCLYRVACPIGVVGVIFESRPDAMVQIASLCVRSGNAALLKGGSEAAHSNRALFESISRAVAAAGIPDGALGLLEARSDVDVLLGANGIVDLIVPRGSNDLVRSIQARTTIPVLGHAEGLCHLYVDATADLGKALRLVVDAKTSYPSACNAVETLLVHLDVAPAFLPAVVSVLSKRGVEVRCDERSRALAGAENTMAASEEDWRTEYCDLVLSVRMVDSLREAIDFINEFGSGHTDAIVTEDRDSWETFFAEVDSAGVYLNASTRFADGYRYGFGAEVGISTGKLHPRGPVGLEGLVTYKYKLVGNGHIVCDYTGPQARRFTHRNLMPGGYEPC
jgi:glutamate-5-semialdehyde dehydrogenase